ncbi:hypothetical protein CDD81_4869 [Ophiocordyceps australis]|uniref:Uncharacterized protein n=1 Tax=Ophiocordyceps australis TaxID=1399860 RepID=A0A2C5Y435_9HYPO|nr:hypothetical protein CDD81_4869 [Ophiocordyceps australis]
MTSRATKTATVRLCWALLITSWAAALVSDGDAMQRPDRFCRTRPGWAFERAEWYGDQVVSAQNFVSKPSWYTPSRLDCVLLHWDEIEECSGAKLECADTLRPKPGSKMTKHLALSRCADLREPSYLAGLQSRWYCYSRSNSYGIYSLCQAFESGPRGCKVHSAMDPREIERGALVRGVVGSMSDAKVDTPGQGYSPNHDTSPSSAAGQGSTATSTALATSTASDWTSWKPRIDIMERRIFAAGDYAVVGDTRNYDGYMCVRLKGVEYFAWLGPEMPKGCFDDKKPVIFKYQEGFDRFQDCSKLAEAGFRATPANVLCLRAASGIKSVEAFVCLEIRGNRGIGCRRLTNR